MPIGNSFSFVGSFLKYFRQTWLGDETHNGVEIVITNVTSKLDVLNKSRSDAINYGMETKDLIAKLSSFEEQLDLRIFHAETDTIEFTYKNTPKNYSQLAQGLFELCPDIVHQGVGSIENLEELLMQQKMVYLWWD